MKRVALASVLVSIGAFAACTVAEPETGGGTAATGNTPAGGAAGAGPQGGNSGSNASGAGGTTSGTSGASGTGTGGTPMAGNGGGPPGGSGGTPPMGGMGMGGAMGGMGNVAGANPQGGMAGMSGGAPPGGMGGMAAGMGGMSGGMAGTGGTSTCASIETVFNTDRRFDGRLTETPCRASNSNDCTGGGWRVNGGSLTQCDGQNRLDANQTIMVGGVMGQNYTVTLRFFGIVEPKAYGNNVTRQDSARPTNNADSTCVGTGNNRICGANPPPFAYRTGTGATACTGASQCYNDSDYNSYEIHVRNPAGQEVCSYFLNADTTQGHWTYSLNYARTINVIGGGSIRIRSYDQNCRMIKNCTTNTSATDCTAYARTVSIAGAAPAPANLNQPGLGVDAANGGQWFLIDVLNVACATAAPANCAPLPNP